MLDRLTYHKRTGSFTWKNGKRKGKPAGTTCATGYRQIQIDKEIYLVHRLVWLVENGKWPGYLTHINGDRADNRIGNLKEKS